MFSDMELGSPLEELEATLEKKVRMYTNLGEAENAERVTRTHALAMAKLEAVLAAPRAPTGK